jgi:DNA-binding NarL/FixJ family response regulator
LKKDLSKREFEVLRLLAEGKVNRQVAEQLGISVRTVEGHRARIMLKLELSSLSELIRYAVRTKIVDV